MEFHEQLQHTPVRFSACNLFNLDGTLVYGVSRTMKLCQPASTWMSKLVWSAVESNCDYRRCQRVVPACAFCVIWTWNECTLTGDETECLHLQVVAAATTYLVVLLQYEYTDDSDDWNCPTGTCYTCLRARGVSTRGPPLLHALAASGALAMCVLSFCNKIN